MHKRDYDAVVVGSGPNGFSAAIMLQRQGLSVLIVEAKESIGGGLRTQELTLPGFKHDVCSAIVPLAIDSPFFEQLPLKDHGLEFIYPPIPAAHPFMDGSVALLKSAVKETAELFGKDEHTYLDVVGTVSDNWPLIRNDILSPLHFPRHPLLMAAFGWEGLRSAVQLSKKFSTAPVKALFAGMAAHSIQPLNNFATSAFGLVMMATAHNKGWPLAKGGSVSIANALASYFISIGGKIQTSFNVKHLSQLPSSHAVLFDVTPKQLLRIAGERFSSLYSSQLSAYRYGAGVFKIDWALDAPAPFINQEAQQAGTIHLGNSIAEIIESEKAVWENRIAENPFVLFTQQSLFDSSRAPEGKHTAWAYCHTPRGSLKDMTAIIEKQVERFAPGFRERILARHTMDTARLEEYNSNYIGGDINGGSIDIRQLFTRPALRFSPYRTSAKGLYICSSSTPPGGGVHGMCGYHAARRVLKDIFKTKKII
ncbi:MAG: NAD(P)/FAD-dependent oxidoreductase [Chitinophagaceae bacterium]|nr:NAD(P)/FAD-dependent oxidoreductase [Chitinophagaceae bacterium]